MMAHRQIKKTGHLNAYGSPPSQFEIRRSQVAVEYRRWERLGFQRFDLKRGKVWKLVSPGPVEAKMMLETLWRVAKRIGRDGLEISCVLQTFRQSFLCRICSAG